MSIELHLDSKALQTLLANSSEEFKLELERGVLQNFANQYIKASASAFGPKLTTAIDRAISEELSQYGIKNPPGFYGSITLSGEVQTAISKAVRMEVSRHIETTIAETGMGDVIKRANEHLNTTVKDLNTRIADIQRRMTEWEQYVSEKERALLPRLTAIQQAKDILGS